MEKFTKKSKTVVKQKAFGAKDLLLEKLKTNESTKSIERSGMNKSSESGARSLVTLTVFLIIFFLIFSGSCSNNTNDKDKTNSQSLNTQISPSTASNTNSSSNNSSKHTASAKSSDVHEDQRLKTTVLEDPYADLIAEPMPQNGEILSGYNYGDAGIEVTASNANVFVKVKSASSDTVISFFIQKNSTARVYVNSGTYAIQFASGDGTWYGQSGCFGSKTSYGQDTSVSLGYGDIVSYTLKLSSNGNFSMKSLDPDEF